MYPMSTDLKSRISALAVARAAALFRTTEIAQSPPTQDALPDPADLSGGLSMTVALRAPMLGKELQEGRLIESAVAAALEAPKHSLLCRLRVPTTDSDLNLVATNAVSSLDGIKPPAPGRFLGKWEIDVARHHQPSGLLQCIDVKRTVLDDEDELDQRKRIEAASIAAPRYLTKLTISRIEVTTLRWYTTDAAMNGDICTRDTIDAALHAPVRETVETALAAFRAEFDRRLDLLVHCATARQPTEPPQQPRAERLRSATEVTDAPPMTLKEALRLAMRARRA